MSPEPTRDRRMVRRAIPWLWLALSVVWAVVIFVTDQLAWPLALWVATTVGPLTALRARTDQKTPDLAGLWCRPMALVRRR